MKNFIFGFLIGGVVSGTATYFICKKKFDKDKKEIVDACEDTIVKIRKYYSEQVPEKAAVVKEEPSEVVKKYHDISSVYRVGDVVKGEPILVKVDPAELERPTDDAPDEYYEDEVGADPEDVMAESYGREAERFDKENRHREPERILPDEFGNAPGFDAEEITYYVDDDTYCNEDEMIIQDEVSLFGTVVNGWDTNHEDTNSIYIRNYQYNVDFKIDKMFCPCPMNPSVYE